MKDEDALRILKNSSICRIGGSFDLCESHCALAHECTLYAAMKCAIKALEEHCSSYKVCKIRKQEDIIQAFSDCED